MNTNYLKLINVSKNFHQNHYSINIFDNISYTFSNNTSYALVGPSGIGKSTLLYLLSGIDYPSSGTISFNGQIISSHNFEQRIALLSQAISIIFQHPSLIGELSVLENVILKSIIQNQYNEITIKHGKNLLQEIGLDHICHNSPKTLSGGQQQRIAILRALCNRPSFLLADEPTGNLDNTSAQQIIDMLFSYKEKYSMGLIISTHNMNIAEQCDIVLQIENTKLKHTSPAKRFL